jgi:tetratricopeptide (TPR) repeat protein
MYYLNKPELALEMLSEYEQDYMSDSLVNEIPIPWLESIKGIPMAAMGRLGEAKRKVAGFIRNTNPGDKSDLGRHLDYLGEIYRIEKNFDSAATMHEKAFELKKTFGRLSQLGMIYNELERFDKAVLVLEDAMSKYDTPRYYYPDRSVKCHYRLGRAYEGVGRTAEAVEQYETFLDIWKNADEGLESVEDAKQRLARLKS